MADIPSKPDIPTPPDRQEPSTFSSRADTWVAFFPTLADYLAEIATFADQRAGDAMAIVIANGIPGLTLADFAGRAIGVDAGGTMLEGIVFQDLDKATQAIAEAGTNNADFMTALRVKQLAEALFPSNNGWVKIVTKTANGDSELVFSGDDFNDSLYVDYQFVLRNILPASDSRTLRLVPSDDDGANATKIKHGTATAYATTGYFDVTSAVGMSADEPGASGSISIYNFHADKGAMVINTVVYITTNGMPQGPATITEKGSLQQPSVDGPLNHIKFEFDSGNISSGSITLMGLRS